MDATDWRTQLQPDSRQSMITKIVETLKRHLPITGSEGLVELDKIAVRFEEKIFDVAASQATLLCAHGSSAHFGIVVSSHRLKIFLLDKTSSGLWYVGSDRCLDFGLSSFSLHE
ncbi:hypothetical protein MKW98_009475 [Papaver atlanticum]|uniref:Mediator complex subunit 15 KIX domain-containing protein n=1 Tax=Papaver atlanticum TaxID=357466 RepID=A0AAD4SG69_9MAGN|nr:hypothetical protein MKW98_009475 [Papaver atlanticum]